MAQFLLLASKVASSLRHELCPLDKRKSNFRVGGRATLSPGGYTPMEQIGLWPGFDGTGFDVDGLPALRAKNEPASDPTQLEFPTPNQFMDRVMARQRKRDGADWLMKLWEFSPEPGSE